MVETLQNLALALVLALACGILAVLLKNGKQTMLAKITALAQKAETMISGSGLGSKKKAWVVTQLEAAGVTVTAALSKAIDSVVAALNEKSGWYTETATAAATQAASTIQSAVKDAAATIQTAAQSAAATVTATTAASDTTTAQAATEATTTTGGTT